MPKEELQKRIVEEQQNNNLSVEILNGNTETLTGLVGNTQTLKEPGKEYNPWKLHHSMYSNIPHALFAQALQKPRHRGCGGKFPHKAKYSNLR